MDGVARIVLPSAGAGCRSTTQSATSSPYSGQRWDSTRHQPAIRPPDASATPADRSPPEVHGRPGIYGRAWA